MKNKAAEILNQIINPKNERIITHSLYVNIIILMMIMIYSLSTIINFFIGLKYSLVISFIQLLFSIGFLILNRNKKNFHLVLIMGFFSILISLNIFYFYNFGNNGPIVYFVFLFTYLIIYYADKSFKTILFIILIVNMLLLQYLNYEIPSLVDNYTQFEIQIIDHYLSFFFVVVAFIILIRNLIKIQNRETSIALESSHLKTAFLANTSHDLRAPTNSILSFSELLTQKDLSKKETQKYVNILHSNSQQLLNLIHDILDISIIESKSLDIVYQYVNINDTLEELYSNFKREIEISNKNIELTVNFGLPITQSIIYTDPVRLKQIFTNLLQNAVKHTTNGAIAFGYDIKFDSNELLFYIKDTGIGIPPENLDDIFDRYVTNISETKKIKGTGLGLHITKSLVELMKGKVWVESKVEIGTQFYFTLPLKDRK